MEKLPEQCLISKFIPVYEKIERTMPDIHRPIALSTTFSKLVEIFTKQELTKFVTISEYQFQSKRKVVDLVQNIYMI